MNGAIMDIDVKTLAPGQQYKTNYHDSEIEIITVHASKKNIYVCDFKWLTGPCAENGGKFDQATEAFFKGPHSQIVERIISKCEWCA